MIFFKQSGNFNNTEEFIKRVQNLDVESILRRYGQMGVDALSAATPVDSSLTANSWSYDIISNKKGVSISWTNSNVVDGVPVVILLQYGHGTGNGGYVRGKDFINPAIRPVFRTIADAIWREVAR